MVKKQSANAGDTRDMGSIPGLGRSPAAGYGNPLQYSCLGNPTDRGAWQATVHGLTKESDLTSVQFSHSVVSDSLRPHEPQHARLPCPSPTLRAWLVSCPSSQWCHPTISSSVVPFSSCFLPSLRAFPNESVLCIRWAKYWSFSFSISPSNEYSRLISFRIDWFDFLSVQGLSRLF